MGGSFRGGWAGKVAKFSGKPPDGRLVLFKSATQAQTQVQPYELSMQLGIDAEIIFITEIEGEFAQPVVPLWHPRSVAIAVHADTTPSRGESREHFYPRKLL